MGWLTIGIALTLFACESKSNFKPYETDSVGDGGATSDGVMEPGSRSDTCGGECSAYEACVEDKCVPALCPPEGPYGVMPGDTLTDVTVKDCDGNDVHIHELCGANVGFFNLLAGW